MKIRYYGSLKNTANAPDSLQRQTSISVEELVRLLKIPQSAVKLVMVNHSPAHPASLVQPDDSVALFPREYPFFADWKDYWWKG